ncbi:RIC1-domain-containing protein [Hygrophoropsis aurantiaca]|uniref:RIC1-domain-containing protein n=1 Tax=Hygrophoropsis aurantiaca TaxID=72124 RepID=A0ACB8AQC6_9AGAM|nr:RIC1-domain-containing protein [Hygrophoropsis aurantiaca]
MYFPTSAARQLSTVPALPDVAPEPILALEASPRKSLFCTLTKDALTVWRVRPSAPLAYLSRTATSLAEHGENTAVTWSPDGSRIVIQTTLSYLVLVTVDYMPDASVYQAPEIPPGAQRNFLAGPGEGLPLQSIGLAFEGVIKVEGNVVSVSPRKNHIMFSTSSPPAVQRIPWPAYGVEVNGEEQTAKKSLMGYDTWILNDHELPWLADADVFVAKMLYSTPGIETWLTSDGRAYFVRLLESSHDGEMPPATPNEITDETTSDSPNQANGNSRASIESSQHHYQWQGSCIHDFEVPRWVQKRRHVDSDSESVSSSYIEPRRAVEIAVNVRFSMIAVGTQSGSIEFTGFPLQDGSPPKSQTLQIPNPYSRPTGSVCKMEWSSDGYVLAVGWTKGWAIFSVGGRCLASGFGVDDILDSDKFHDSFMSGIKDLFWSPGNFELIVLAHSSPNKPDGQIFVLPFAKSATTCQHSPDNTRYAFLQMDDRALVYRGADQPDMSVINPESDVWQHIKIPQPYLSANWPIRYSALSSDGRLIAIAGRRGLIHYSSTSGRWKLFSSVAQEQAFFVKGGLLWFHHVLVAAVEVSKSYQIRLYSRDLELSNQNVLHREVISSPVIILSLVDNSLLVYTADNMLSHYLIVPTTDSIKLHLCGSITFSGIIASPSAVRVLSWMIPSAQKQLGDPVDDLSVATVLMMVGGQLVLLRPRKSGNQEVNYDMQIFADRIEFCWIHLRGIGALENSLWGYDGQGIRVWLNALAIESDSSVKRGPNCVKESVNIPLDFYPLSVLMDKGIIIGAEHEAATRMNLPFVMFRHATSSHLFLHHILRYHLESGQGREAVNLAIHYQDLVFFAHALEILLHTVVESEATLDSDSDSADDAASTTGVLPAVIEFLDHFEASLDVVVGCARKTEVTRWKRLFSIVGNPQMLFETCLSTNRLKTAASYLLVLHNLEQLDEDNHDAVRLLQSAIDAQDWQLCREILRFLHSIDDTGKALNHALTQTNLTVD